jgi:hypothetical protein
LDGGLDELWVVLSDYPEYAASTHGNIRRVVPSPWSKATPLKHAIGSSGYSQISILSGGKRKSCDVHRLVARTFLGPCPVGMEVGHLDNNRQNCRLDNLVYCTPKQNHAHRMKCGNAMRGSANHKSKLTEMAVRVIKRLPDTAERDLAEVFGVTPGAIYAVRHGLTWKWIG